MFFPLFVQGQKQIRLKVDKQYDLKGNFDSLKTKFNSANNVKLVKLDSYFDGKPEIDTSKLRAFKREFDTNNNQKVKYDRIKNIYVDGGDSTFQQVRIVQKFHSLLDSLLTSQLPNIEGDSVSITQAQALIEKGLLKDSTNFISRMIADGKITIKSSEILRWGLPIIVGIIFTILLNLKRLSKIELFKFFKGKSKKNQDMKVVQKSDKEIIEDLTLTNDDLLRDCTLLEEKLRQKDETITLLADKITELEKKIEKSNFSNTVEPKSIVTEQTSFHKFYLSTPNADGSFRDNRSNTMNPSSHVYQFELIDSGRARFSLIEHSAVISEAIAYPESYLKPVCDYDGGFNPNAKNIKMVNKGYALLKGDKWELDKKALIKLT